MSAALAAPAPRNLEAPLPFARAARGVFDLSIEGMVWSRRSLIMAVLLGLPVVFGLVYRALPQGRITMTGFDLYGVIVALYYVRNILPLAALFYATALIADEVEGKTLTYLLSRPIRRRAILAGKFAAYVATTVSMTLPAMIVTFFLLVSARGWSGIGARVSDLFQDMGAAVLALLAYGALFTFLGVLLRRPVIPGLLFLFVWELVANLPGYMPRFTITAYLRSLIHHRPAEEGLWGAFQETLPTLLCLEALGAIIVVFLGAAFWIFSRREYVMEQ